MNLLSPNVSAIGYLLAAVCFILALKGLSSPASARRGNLIGAGGAVLAVLVAFLSESLHHVPLILLAIGVGSAVGVPAARRVAMTQMPQLVALFNGVGGGAAVAEEFVDQVEAGEFVADTSAELCPCHEHDAARRVEQYEWGPFTEFAAGADLGGYDV